MGQDAVVHLAADTRVMDSIDNPAHRRCTKRWRHDRRRRRLFDAAVHREHSSDSRARTLLDDAVETIRRRGPGEGV